MIYCITTKNIYWPTNKQVALQQTQQKRPPSTQLPTGANATC